MVDCTLDHLHAEVDSCCSAAGAPPRSAARQNNSDLLHCCRSNSDFEAVRRAVGCKRLDRCNSPEVERQCTEPAHGQAVVVQLPIRCRGMVSCPDDGGGVR